MNSKKQEKKIYIPQELILKQAILKVKMKEAKEKKSSKKAIATASVH